MSLASAITLLGITFLAPGDEAHWAPKNKSFFHKVIQFLGLQSLQNRNFRPKGEGRSGRRPLLPKRKLNILVDLTLGKSYHSVVTFLHAQKSKYYTLSI